MTREFGSPFGSDEYTFAFEGGEQISLVATSNSSASFTLEIRSPEGALLTDEWVNLGKPLRDLIRIPSAGDYTVSLSVQDHTLTYTLSLIDVQ